MDRRKFIGGLTGNLLAAPIAAWAQPVATAIRASGAGSQSPLSTLAASKARKLGPYASSEVGGAWIADYSGIVHDPMYKRICLFGGGHGPSQETDIRIFDLASLKWASLYAPTPRSEMTPNNCDKDKGRWTTTNQPTARHTYNMTLVAGRRFYMLQNTGMPDHLDVPSVGSNLWGGRVCWYDFEVKSWSYSQQTEAETPWYYAAAAALDPISGQIIVFGPNKQAGAGHLYLYDPATDSIATGPSIPDVGYALDLVYFPPNDKFYAINTCQMRGAVWEIAFDRKDSLRSTIAPIAVTGVLPQVGSTCGFDYDSVNHIIGGNIHNGVFHSFDPRTKAWSATRVAMEADATEMPDQAFHCLAFDPDSGCFLFLSKPPAATTWAYRYSGNVASGSVTGVSDLEVSLDFGGGRIATFSGVTAMDQGDFIGEFVRQKCFLATNPAFPDWRVYFRVDADKSGRRILAPAAGWRDEVIVEYGRSTHGVPVHLKTPYTATILQHGKPAADYMVRTHWWYARWRHQSSVRAVVRTPANLKERGWIANFGPEGLFGLSPNTNAVSWDGPMSAPRDPVLGAFANTMGAAGDNAQIGFLTEYAADYVINASPPSLTSARTEGEWCGNWCMHIRDDASGAMPDVRNRKLRYKEDGGTINGAPPVDPQSNPSFVSIETAHFYPCANLPWLLTDDPFFLEELQFGCNWQILYDAYHRGGQKLEGLVYPGQTRSFAWGLRDLFQLAASCPTVVPAWLRPRSYWQSCIDDNKAFALRYVNSPARIHALFRTWTRSDMNAAWMSAWLNAVVGISVEQGFSDWKPIFDWGIDLHIQQSNGTSGWPRQWPVPYYFSPNKAKTSTPSLYFSDAAPDVTTCKSWADLWSYYCSGSDGRTDASGHTIDTKGWDGHTLMQQNYQSGPSFFLHLRAALAVAVRQGVESARECYDFIQGELAGTTMPHYGVKGQARFSIDPDDSVRRATKVRTLPRERAGSPQRIGNLHGRHFT